MKIIALVIAYLVYISFLTPTPDIVGHVRTGQPIEALSYYIVAPVEEGNRRAAASIRRRSVFDGLTVPEQQRCWMLFRMIVDILRHAPEHAASVEGVIAAFAEDARARACTNSSASSRSS